MSLYERPGKVWPRTGFSIHKRKAQQCVRASGYLDTVLKEANWNVILALILLLEELSLC